ncbi:MAG TPA: FeoB small GTPase domain-containing protein, partial [Elusimicrobiales bacterium]|nr:FeoB small GTPase domain-containing protein [Elusimicrobiales bacterium]
MKSSEITDLLSMRENERGIVSEITGGPNLTGKLKAMGIHPGRRIVRRTPEGYKGPVIVEVMGSRVAIGCGMASKIKVSLTPSRILLTGNPNVGKSVVFSRLTGLDAISSNYPGTTVSYTTGSAALSGGHFLITDVPGAYSLSPANKAEEAARDMIVAGKKDLLIHILDATNLERNLFFALEVLELGVPTIILLNKFDIARRGGTTIAHQCLENMLGVTVIPFVATTGEGLKALNDSVRTFLDGGIPFVRRAASTADEKWKFIGQAVTQCQRVAHKHPGFLEKLEDLTSKPSTGIPFALAALIAVFFIIRTAGETLINYILDPLFTRLYMPALEKAANLGHLHGFLRSLLLGSVPSPMEGFGLLTTGLYIPLVTVLPYIVAFYLVLSFLEDIGYLPRLAVLLDNFMHRLGLHGYGYIPLMLGLGCKVPAILAVRVLENRRERVIATALTLAAAPCMPQSAMILSIFSPYPLKYTLAVFAAIALAGLSAALLLSRLIKGETPELFLEIPPYQLPSPRALWLKVWLRLRDFLFEA